MEKLTALRVFRRVVELESFTRAAKDLRISNAAASKNVRELEEELGIALLQRTTRRLHLTPAGAAYYERTAALLDELADADRAAGDLATLPRGLLRVGAPMSIGLTTVMPAVTEFLVRHPDVRIELEMNDRVVDVVREGFDVCVRGTGALADSSLVARKLVALGRTLVAAPAYLARAGEPRAPAQLAAHRCLVYSLASAPTRWTLVRGQTQRSVDVDGPLHVNSSLALVRAAVAGLGIALVPTVTVARELAEGALVTVLPAWSGEAHALHAVYPRHRQSSRNVRLLVDHLVTQLGVPSGRARRAAVRPR